VTLHTLFIWAAYIFFTFAWTFTNSIQSRAKQYRSIRANAVSTFVTSILYIGSVLLIGNFLLEAKQSRRVGQLLLAICAYGTFSVAGSCAGQKWAIRFEDTHPKLSSR
jgi:hypothetical protein